MKHFYLFVLALFLSIGFISAQNVCFSGRYKSRVFSSYIKYGDIKYAEVQQISPPYLDENLHMDVYMPDGDVLKNRPIVVFAHASAFLFNDKTCDVAKAYADTFTRRGYVFASLDYRMGFDPLDGTSSMRAAYAAIQDGKSAIRFIKEYADTFGIDTNNIIFAGSSAGGIMALYAAYADKESERPAESYAGLLSPDLGCWECSGNTYKHTSKIKAAISMWGAVLDVSMIDDPNAPPCMLIHGTADQIVPYGTGHPFQFPVFPESSGSLIIDQQATAIGLKHEFYPFEILGINHEFYGSANGNWLNLIGPNQYWDTVTTLFTQYTFKQIQPQTSVIAGAATVYQNNLQQTYTVDYHTGSSYCWTITGGSIISSNSNSVTVLWNTTGYGQLKVTEITDYMAEGNPQVLDVNIMQGTTTGINNLTENQTMSIYPNPANSLVQFNLNTNEHVSIKIYNAVGQEINTIHCQNQKTVLLDVSKFSSGTYTCKARLANGNLFATEKLIVQ